MELIHRTLPIAPSVAILPGSFHPPTIAHLGLAQAALARVGTVIFTLPRAFPHKRYDGVPLATRLALLEALAGAEPRFAVAISEGGLFLDMAREFRRLQPSASELFLLCGRDAAERILAWPYPANEPIERQLDEYRLLVAARQGEFLPPRHLSDRIEPLPTATNWDEVSSTAVRAAISKGELWRHLVPGPVAGLIESTY